MTDLVRAGQGCEKGRMWPVGLSLPRSGLGDPSGLVTSRTFYTTDNRGPSLVITQKICVARFFIYRNRSDLDLKCIEYNIDQVILRIKTLSTVLPRLTVSRLTIP